MITSERSGGSTYRFVSGNRYAFDSAVDALDGHHTPYCWGCGPDAQEGLELHPYLDGNEVAAELTFAPRFEGGPGTVHGGAIAAFMDDLLGYVPVVFGSPGVTAKLDTHFRNPVPLGVAVNGRAWMSDVEGRKMWAEGTIEADGVVLVEASALFLAIDATHWQKVFESLSEEQRERNLTYRSSDYYP